MKEKLEQFMQDYLQTLEQEKEKLQQSRMPALTEELFAQFEQCGNRTQYEAAYFGRRKYLTVFGILAVVYRRTEDIRMLEQVLKEICREECWALPAHVDRSRDPDWRITVELFAAETAQSVAELITLLKGELSEEIRQMAKNEVFRRVLQPYCEREPYAWWETCDMNWCAVCNGAIGCAAIDLMQEQTDRLDALLARIGRAIRHYPEGFAADGACMEGLGYYTYGFSFYVNFADRLRQYTKGKIDLLDGEKTEKMAGFQQCCFLPGGHTLSFSDGSSQERFRVGLTAYLAMRFPAVQLPDLSLAAGLESDACYRYAVVSRDLYFTKRYIEWLAQREKEEANGSAQMRQDHTAWQQTHTAWQQDHTAWQQDHTAWQQTACTVLPDAQWSVCVGANGCAMAAKGGHNQEPHNHNDVGSFLYLAQGELFLTDLGAGEYTKSYFGAGRYEILCNRSLGHNVPLIDGREQRAGKEYRSASFAADGKGMTQIGMETAYEAGAAKKILRTLLFDTKTGTLEATDHFTVEPEQTVTENLVTSCPAKLQKDGFCLEAAGKTCHIRYENGENPRILSQRHINHAGESEPVFLLQWDVPAKSQKQERKTRFRVFV